jgi:hypothetical protein
MNKRTAIPTLIAGTTLIGAASYFFFTPIKGKILKGIEKVKASKNMMINTSHDEVYFV